MLRKDEYLRDDNLLLHAPGQDLTGQRRIRGAALALAAVMLACLIGLAMVPPQETLVADGPDAGTLDVGDLATGAAISVSAGGGALPGRLIAH
ncbi:hypothetical protein [Arenibaculum pallidiluteum]|uniref:hypothetical protein n=1 Tax=Arenibaculum pallidiluteum TaxID=2812559 RepID=UPI001A957A71|nr:hypothetical protein [Arenibaculum pallidiluteum]